jgi:hypothetical protein
MGGKQMNIQHNSSAVEQEFSGADVAMVDLLSSLRQDPSPALVTRVRGIPTMREPKRQAVLRWAWGLAAAALLFVVLVSASPSLRAAIASLDVTIGNIRLSVADRSPDSSDARIVEPEMMSLEAAREAVPFAFRIPTEIPDGLAMDEWVRVNDLGGGPFVEMQWAKLGGGGFSFAARQDPGSSSWLVGLDSYREIEIGGEPAIIITGGWDADSREWAWLEHTTLIWTVDGVQYTLGASADNFSETDLIAIAESVR